ncbi:hypothetical protein H6F86_02995 [Phormidium sp. FACHB-592]|uniref:Uncharacterized protein n=1 Tax=Stenomitos frigidus AS-A4 TaxID=2933935 RepID=A0ABV0KNV0_9CYAN|nr:hypothetical protein [Phormidium sp. FACHB-592]MBD2072870.1 hypothetical protein [Phormidium sp. FACHB-592]
MLSNDEFEAWCCRLHLSDEAIEGIQRIHNSPPSRLISGSKKAISGRYPSRKIKQATEFESHQKEIAHPFEYKVDDK